MPDFYLMLHGQRSPDTAFAVLPEGVTIGRSSENAIQLTGTMVSRTHARVWTEADALFIRDTDSRNGVFVNGARINGAQLLYDGDEIGIGNHRLFVNAPDAELPLRDTSSTISLEGADDIYNSLVRDDSKGRLPMLLKAAHLMGTVFDMDELFNQTLQLILEALPVHRGYILTLEKDTGKPLVRASLPREDPGGPPISRQIIQHVFRHKTAILTRNAQEDIRFEGSESIFSHAICSAMCVPLCGRSELAGAMYVDSGSGSQVFSDEDFGLFAALGRVIGIAFENATLHEEHLRQERLAAIGQATAGIGHCVKNILTGIKGGGEFIEMGIQETNWKWVQRGWPLLHVSVERIEELVLNLLAVSRDQSLSLEPSRLEILVTQVLDMLRPRAHKVDVELRFDRGEVGTIYIDSTAIFRVILNLAINAIEACQEKGGGVVVISTRRDPSGCFVDVADNGPGVKRENLERLFQAFFSTKGGNGTGLGLACCERFVNAHGGEINVMSEEGKGARFTVFLPERSPGTLARAGLTGS